MLAIWRKLILSIRPPRVVTIIGGGGKTSLMYYLLTLLQADGYTAVGTTTTKLASKPLGGSFVQISNVKAGYKAVQLARSKQDYVTLISGADAKDPHKMVGIPGEWIDQLATICRDVVFVVEGDGSAGKSLKGHLAHEPVFPRSSSLVIPVIGIDCVGVKLNSQNVHRPERICTLTGTLADSLVTTKIITQLLFHPQGYLNNCPEHTLIVPFINKVESVLQHQQAEELGRQILVGKHPQLGGVIVGSLLQEEGLWLQV